LNSRFAVALSCVALSGAAAIAGALSPASGEVVNGPPLVRVPGVEGMRPGLAERRLRRWHFEPEYTVLDKRVCAGLPPGGRIVRQDPSAGALAPAFSTVKLQDSCQRGRARRQVVVPDVSGRLTVLRAYRVLRRRGLRVAIPASFSVASLCMPWADRQSPPAGKRVRRGAVVRLSGLRCALASPGTPVPTPPPVVVPDFTGDSVSAAVHWAEAAHLDWEATDLAPLRPSWQMHLFDNYVVTSQDPAAGSTASAGTSLHLRAREP
jgi:beta-lactam-binding protein with PASTA domain